MISAGAAAQDTVHRPVVISYAPAGFVNKIRFKSEFPVSSRVSTGAFVSLYYFTFRGPEVEPYLRWYVSEDYPEGFYVQLKASAGYYSSRMEFTHMVSDSLTMTVKQTHSFPAFGAGIAFGYQYVTRKQRLFDFFAGYKNVPFAGPDHIFENGMAYRTDSDFLWYAIGPGSYFNGHFGIGYSF